MADVVQRPTFAPEEIERQRQQALSALKVAAEDPESVAERVIDRLIYGFHPYGMPGAGTAESLPSLTRADFVEFHKQLLRAQQRADRGGRRHRRRRGDGRPREALRRVEAGEVPALDRRPSRPTPTRRVIVIDKKDAVQTEIRVGHIAIPRKHNDYEAVDQAVKILGGEGANRLQQVLRIAEAADLRRVGRSRHATSWPAR